MSISYDVTATLREQMKHHEPIVLIMGGRCAYGFIPRESGKTRSIGYGVEVLPTMNADGNYAVLVYDARGNGGQNSTHNHRRSPRPGNGLYGNSSEV